MSDEIIQGTPEWFALRLGKVTASRVSDVLATIKSGEAKTRADYKMQLVGEIITGSPSAPIYQNDMMKWGVEYESEARAKYEIMTNQIVIQTAFVNHPTIKRAGCSPDGLIGENLIEIKCPSLTTHLGYLLAGVVPTAYRSQIMWQMACTGAQWCDFVSYRPDLPEHLQLFTVRMDRDNEAIKKMETEVEMFLTEVEEIVQKLTTKKGENDE